MIRILLEVQEGVLRALEVEGHATRRGSLSIPCAGVSILARTAARLLEERLGGLLEGEASEEGSLWIRIPFVAADREWLEGVTAFLKKGFEDLAREYPEDIDYREE